MNHRLCSFPAFERLSLDSPTAGAIGMQPQCLLHRAQSAASHRPPLMRAC